MIKKTAYTIISSILLIAAPALAYAQTYADLNNKVNIGIISPEAASLGKFGNVPVSYSTGVPSITIPVYNIKVAEINVPISFDYHAGGVRVDEISSSVGIGWALNAGGGLSRSAIGFPDESSRGYLYSPDPALVTANPANYVDYIYDSGHGLYDTSPDAFQYNFPGGSGKFIYKRSGLGFDQFPLTNNVITRYGANLFKVTDQNGTQYLFEDTEYTYNNDPNSLMPTYVSTWKLSKIVSKNLKDTVFFEYDKVGGLLQHVRSWSHTVGSSPYCGGGSPQAINADNYNDHIASTDESYVREIRWRGGKLTFTNIADRTDRDQAKRLNEVNVYSKLNGAYKLVKRVKLYQSYFFYQPTGYTISASNPAENLYRLRLDRVEFLDINGVQPPQVYSMTYNSTNMAARTTSAQDKWGFNNGRFSNITLLPQKTILFDQVGNGSASYFTFGDADRECDPAYLKACTIESMTYPTGGKTLFELEPHKFNTNVTQTVTNTIRDVSEGAFRSTSSTTFTVTSSMTNLRYNAYISPYNYPDVSNRPEIKVIDQANSQQVLFVNTLNASTGITIPTSALNHNELIVGHTYTITTNIYTTNPNVSASLSILYDTQTASMVSLDGGGLRIKSITDMDNNGAFVSKKSYAYGSDGTGYLLTPYDYFMLTSETIINRTGCGNCTIVTAAPSVTYRSSSVVQVSQISGSPIVYENVTEYEENASGGKTNGKKVFSYNVYGDQSALAYNNQTWAGVQLVNSIWRNGFLKLEETYKSDGSGGYAIVEKKHHNYLTTRWADENLLRLKYKYNNSASGCEIRSGGSVSQDFFIDAYPMSYAAILLLNEVSTQYDDSGNAITTTKAFNYDATSHILPTSTSLVNSQGETLSEEIQYPVDLAVSGNIYQQMVGRNIISPPVSITVKKNGSQLKQAKVVYQDWLSNGRILMPISSSGKILAYPQEDIMNYKYGEYGNVLEQSHTNGPSESYIWDYNETYPIAVVTNAAVNQIAYTSFEAEGAGNWTIPGALRSTAAALTGKQCYALANGAISKSGLSSTTTYVVSYWTQNPPLNNPALMIAGTISGYPVKGDTRQGWTYYEHRITGQTSISVSGTAGSIDELRLYPLGAQMTSYTYEPLVGITSTADAKSQVTYYEYDGFQRLIKIRDQKGNILKQMDYHYKSL